MTSPALASFLRSHRRSLDTFTLSATRRDCISVPYGVALLPLEPGGPLFDLRT